MADSVESKEEMNEPIVRAEESMRVQKAMWVKEQFEEQRKKEDEMVARMFEEQRMLNEQARAMTEDMSENRQLKRYHENCLEDLNEQVYALHGISMDKLEGMKQYKNARYQGLTIALFLMSAVLLGVCAWAHGLISDITLFMLAGLGVEGALLSQDGRRGKVLDFICRILYVIPFPVMLVAFVCFEMDMNLYKLIMEAGVFAGVGFLVVGTIAFFLHNPYRMEQKKVRAAEADLKFLEKIAKKNVRKNEKVRLKEEARQARLEEKEEKRLIKQQQEETLLAEKEQERENRRIEMQQRREAYKMHMIDAFSSAKEHVAGVFHKKAEWNEIEDVQGEPQSEIVVEEHTSENIIPMKEKKNA